jgi:hypothetical protein
MALSAAALLFNCSCTGDGPRPAVPLCHRGAARHGVRCELIVRSPVHVLVDQAVDSLPRKQLHTPPRFAASYCCPLLTDRAHASHLARAAWSFHALCKEGHDAISVKAYRCMGAGMGDKPVAMWTQDAYQYVKVQQCTGRCTPTWARDEEAADACLASRSSCTCSGQGHATPLYRNHIVWHNEASPIAC